MPLYGNWQQAADPVREFQQGYSFASSQQERKAELAMRGQQINDAQQRLAADIQHQSIADEIAKQRNTLQVQDAAVRAQSFLGFQRYGIATGDWGKAAMIYGPGMSGGRMTGYAPIFSAAEKRAGAAPVIQRGSLISGGIPGTNTPAMFQQPQAPGDARPIIDPDTGKIVGYSGKDIHMMPQPKESPEDYETEVTKTPGTKGTEAVPGLPGQPAVRHFGGLWTSPAIPPTPGIPGTAGTPEKTITRRIPVAGKPEESGDITYLKPPQPPGAPLEQSGPQAPTGGQKVATPDLIMGLKNKGMDAQSARQWLQDNGYSIPDNASTPPAPAATPSTAPSNGYVPIGISVIDDAVKQQIESKQKYRQTQQEMAEKEKSDEAARARDERIAGLSDEMKKYQDHIEELVRQQQWLNTHAGNTLGVPDSDLELTPLDRAQKIKEAEAKLYGVINQLNQFYQ